MTNLAAFLGHDIKTHRKFYRLPNEAIHLAKISRLLMAVDDGTIEQFHGKSLNEINVNVEVGEDPGSKEENIDPGYSDEDLDDPEVTASSNIFKNILPPQASAARKAEKPKETSVSFDPNAPSCSYISTTQTLPPQISHTRKQKIITPQKRCLCRPECGRQTLQELLIRPVQRLPSIILLLNDILKHTQTTYSDHEALQNAIQALKDVMMHINEDKRKTEGQVAMFDIVNDIENCPPNLLSSHRSLVSKTDMQEITDLLTKKGGAITMFLFTDVLEICKKRSRGTNSLKSPGVVSLTSTTMKVQAKSFKHIDLIPLSHIKRVVDITETEEYRNVFAIVAWSSKELKELLYAFILTEETCKNTFLHSLCRQVADSVCKADTENLLTKLDAQQLALQTSEGAGNMLIKALSKTRDKLGRALSMRRTPTKRGLSRAVSTMISPLRHFGTPSHNMPSLRLSSVTNLTEFDQPPPSLPSSPIGGKKLKSSSLGISMSKLF
ncbi:protein ECT2-like [Uloborus diversus]|uniref:protein ECT2-like n=1 Tax=Uloborus diversus TaxID=327109 RepID=UPI002409834E|nr:protein ECT2-like [Uloborus diversus]